MNDPVKRRQKRLWCLEHDSPNQPCDEYLLEMEVNGPSQFTLPCRVVMAEIVLLGLSGVR